MSQAHAQVIPGSTQSSQRRKRRQIGDRTIANLFIWPTLILLIVVNVFPLFYSLYLSFTDFSVIANQAPQWLAFDNYEQILTAERSRYWHNFTVTGTYAVLSVGLQMIIGFGLAMLLREKFRGSGLITTLLLIPMMLSPVVVGLFWKLIFDPSKGIFNYLIYTNAAGGTQWLSNSTLALWSIVIVDVWMWSPFVMLLCLSGLSAIPGYLYEAAAIDRASAWFQFRRITLPQVAPLLLIAVLFRTIEAFKAFDLVMGLTGGTPGDATETVAVRLYREAFLGKFKTGESSALAYIVLVIIIAASNLYIRALNRVREG
ncbi:carbohydrate ABC transporter permease [Aggregatilinea lenta]|uniref:carbohydrate ABC transporter permease n=1 Tax=Aggregatilinea lenta TaxID=913108 RepID=UPI000E5B96C1|nr:sugar ABC transporter permease [Aggregatilinea lenta]